ALLRRVGGVLGGVGQRAAQGFGERQAILQFGLEARQALSQFLQGVQFALDLGLALLFGEVVVKFRHGAHPVDNAVMITAARSGSLSPGGADEGSWPGSRPEKRDE